MKIQSAFNREGITLIELLVALAISAIVLAGIYQLFISQTKTYAKQDQVVEVQQSVRSAMEILLRDLRMAGFVDDNPASTKTIPTAIVTPVQDSDVTVYYVYYDRNTATYQKYTVRYWRDAASSTLYRNLSIDDVLQNPPATNSLNILLQNVGALNFRYGIDANMDNLMDDIDGDGVITDNDFVTATVKNNTYPTATVVAARVALTGGPNPTNIDVAKVVSPRTLISAVTLRNQCLR